MSPPASPGAEAENVFSPKVVLALLLAGVFAAAAFLALSAYAPGEAARRPGGHALSPSAVGYAGIVRLLQRMQTDASISRSKAALTDAPGLVVETPELFQPLDKLPEHQPRLVVLPKWETTIDPLHAGWVHQVGTIPLEAIGQIFPPAFGKVTLARGPARAAPLRLRGQIPGQAPFDLTTGPVAQVQTLSGAKLTPLLTDADVGVILAAAPVGAVFVLSDPDLLNTQGMADVKTARAAVAILQSLKADNQPIAFDVTLNGIGEDRGLLKTAIEPPFLGATLCLLVVAAMVGVQAWSRFGPACPPSRAVALGKTALADNAAGMIRLAKREPRMARRYVQLCRRRALSALGAQDQDDAALDAFLDRWAEQAGVEGRVAGLTTEAAAVKTIGELTTLARKARRWRLEMTRESG